MKCFECKKFRDGTCPAENIEDLANDMMLEPAPCQMTEFESVDEEE